MRVLKLYFHHEILGNTFCFLVRVVREQLAEHIHTGLDELLLHLDFLVDLHNLFHQLEHCQVFE